MHKTGEYLYNAWNLQNSTHIDNILSQGKSILGEIQMASESTEHHKKRFLLLSTDWVSQPVLWFNIDSLTDKNLILSVKSNFKAHITPLTKPEMLNELTFAWDLLQN